MTDEEYAEFRGMWDTLCFEPFNSVFNGVFCTEPREHKGGHACDFATLDRYHELRLAVRSEKERAKI